MDIHKCVGRVSLISLFALMTFALCVSGVAFAAPGSFSDTFEAIAAEDIQENILKLVGHDFTVITSGKIPNQNSMTASFGGMGILFNKPTTWCFLRASRYTLEIIRNEKNYTMSYFPEQYKNDVVYFGSKTGRDSDKMKNSKLTPITTPDGGSSYEEAKLIIECSLTAINTVSPDEYFTDEGRDFVVEGFNDAKDYHKLVFGEITRVWRRK
jgi:flavin reductase (DIM6/NTAB) family NADH-FMN oxidoreductase RutF